MTTGHVGTSCSDKDVLYLTVIMVGDNYVFVKTHQSEL